MIDRYSVERQTLQNLVEAGEHLVRGDVSKKTEPATVHTNNRDIPASEDAPCMKQGAIATDNDHQVSGLGQ